MPIQGVGAAASQPSLFSTSGAEKSEGAGSVQQQAAVSVLKDEMDQEGQAALQLIQSSVGLGQNVDFKA